MSVVFSFFLEFFDALARMGQEKGIPMEYLVEKIKTAIALAVKKDPAGSEESIVEIDPESRKFYVAMRKEVVEEVEDPATQITIEDAVKHDKKARLGEIVEIRARASKNSWVSFSLVLGAAFFALAIFLILLHHHLYRSLPWCSRCLSTRRGASPSTTASSSAAPWKRSWTPPTPSAKAEVFHGVVVVKADVGRLSPLEGHLHILRQKDGHPKSSAASPPSRPSTSSARASGRRKRGCCSRSSAPAPPSSSTMLETRAPLGPMQAPTGSTFSSRLETASLLRLPASRLMAFRPGPPAEPGHRQQGPERPSGGQTHRLEDRHPPGERLLRGGSSL